MNIPNLENLSIGEPMCLLLLFLIPIVLKLKKGKKRNTIKFSSTQNFESLKSLKIKTMWVPDLFFYLGISLAIISIARPRLIKVLRVYYQVGLILF